MWMCVSSCGGFGSFFFISGPPLCLLFDNYHIYQVYLLDLQVRPDVVVN